MDETVIVIMLKNPENGFLETEIGSYNIGESDSLVYNIFALKDERENIIVHARLTVERDLEDWEFSAVLDFYDVEIFGDAVISIKEDDTGYNPIWEVTFPFNKSVQAMELKISEILKIHKAELTSVYEAIAELSGDYI